MLQSRDCISCPTVVCPPSPPPSWKCPRYSFTGLYSVMLLFSVEPWILCSGIGMAHPPQGWQGMANLSIAHRLVTAAIFWLVWRGLYFWGRKENDIKCWLIFFFLSEFYLYDSSQVSEVTQLISQHNWFCCYCHNLIVFLFVFLRVKAFNSELRRDQRVKHTSEEVVDKGLR